MLYTRYDLPKSLGLFHPLGTSYDPLPLQGDVSMDNTQASSGTAAGASCELKSQ